MGVHRSWRLTCDGCGYEYPDVFEEVRGNDVRVSTVMPILAREGWSRTRMTGGAVRYLCVTCTDGERAAGRLDPTEAGGLQAAASDKA